MSIPSISLDSDDAKESVKTPGKTPNKKQA